MVTLDIGTESGFYAGCEMISKKGKKYFQDPIKAVEIGIPRIREWLARVPPGESQIRLVGFVPSEIRDQVVALLASSRFYFGAVTHQGRFVWIKAPPS